MLCNFCGRKKEEVNLLIAGPYASICDACVVAAVKIIAEQFVLHAPYGAMTAETPKPAVEA